MKKWASRAPSAPTLPAGDFPLPLPPPIAYARAMSTMHRSAVILTLPQIEWLRREASALGITVSDVIRRIVDERRGAVVKGDAER
jgi:hypothetical protein